MDFGSLEEADAPNTMQYNIHEEGAHAYGMTKFTNWPCCMFNADVNKTAESVSICCIITNGLEEVEALAVAKFQPHIAKLAICKHCNCIHQRLELWVKKNIRIRTLYSSPSIFGIYIDTPVGTVTNCEHSIQLVN